MYMDDIKVFAKNEKELKTLIHAVRIYSQDIGMEFSKDKCAILGETETYKYLGILEVDNIKQVEMTTLRMNIQEELES